MKAASVPIFQSPEIRIVEASAGSGKTFALAKRYVQLLLTLSATDAKAMRQILAITFTNKAAFAMKARVLEFLKKAAFGALSQAEYRDIIEPLGWPPKDAAARAGAVMEEILANYHYFQIQTIDKFINAVLSASAFRLGLTAQFRIRTRPGEYLGLCLDRLIERARRDADVRRLFEQFLEHYLYLENRSGWFPKDDILAIQQTLFHLYNTYGLPLGYEPFDHQAVIRRKASVLKELRRLREEMPPGVHKGFFNSLDGFLEKHPKGFDLDDLPESFSKDIRLTKNAELPRSVEKFWNDIRAELKTLCDEEAVGLFSPYAGIFQNIESDFEAVCARADILFLAELNRKAAQLFGGEVISLEEIYARLAARFRHYLVDEFQDTSRLQWSNLKPMVEEALSAGGTFFYVGDRKQAIYGFRGGESRLFDDVAQELAQYPAARETLTSNWRSCEEIVAFNNAVFAPENLQRFLKTREAEQKSAVVFGDDDAACLCSVFETAQQTTGALQPGGYVEACLIDAPAREDRDALLRERLVPLVKNILTRFAPAEIAILNRNNKEVELVTRWLMEEGLSVRSDRTSDIRKNILIREFVAFLAFLNSPIDNAAFAAFLTGKMFAAASGRPAQDWHDFVFDTHLRSRSESDAYLYMEFRKHHPQLWQTLIEPFFKNVGLYPLYELAVSLCHAFGCLQKFPDDQAFVMHLLELIKSREEEFTGLAEFLVDFENLEGEDVCVESIDGNALHVMTIHKSKGLEFPAVVIPSLVMDIKIGSGEEGQPSFVPWEQDGRMHLLRLKGTYYQFSADLKKIYEAESKKVLLSELNAVYVALTRAKEEMYVMIPSKSGNGRNPAQWLIPDGMLRCGDIRTGRRPAKTSGEPLRLSPSPAQDWVAFLKDEFTSEDGAARRQERRLGILVHAMLAQIGDLSAQSVDDLRRLWVKIDADPAEKERAQAIVLKAAADPALRPFFVLNGCSCRNEVEIVNRFGDTRRIDRLIVQKDAVWIVDYKLGREREDQDRKQISEYKNLVSEIYPDKIVKAFVSYLGDNVEPISI